MRIMILHMRFHPDLTGTARWSPTWPPTWSSKGNEVTVATNMPHYAERFHGISRAAASPQRLQRYRPLAHLRLCAANPSGFQRGINYLSYTFMSIVAGLMAKKPDVILCVNPPITVGFSGWLLVWPAARRWSSTCRTYGPTAW